MKGRTTKIDLNPFALSMSKGRFMIRQACPEPSRGAHHERACLSVVAKTLISLSVVLVSTGMVVIANLSNVIANEVKQTLWCEAVASCGMGGTTLKGRTTFIRLPRQQSCLAMTYKGTRPQWRNNKVKRYTKIRPTNLNSSQTVAVAQLVSVLVEPVMDEGKKSILYSLSLAWTKLNQRKEQRNRLPSDETSGATE